MARVKLPAFEVVLQMQEVLHRPSLQCDVKLSRERGVTMREPVAEMGIYQERRERK